MDWFRFKGVSEYLAYLMTHIYPPRLGLEWGARTSAKAESPIPIASGETDPRGINNTMIMKARTNESEVSSGQK